MRRFAFTVPALLALLLVGCPRGPDDPTGEGCLAFEECGECAAQPQCGWCMEGGAGTCIPARSETDRDTPPESCTGAGNTWHSRIPDHTALDGPPYCPRVPPPDAQAPADEPTGGGETGDGETQAGEAEPGETETGATRTQAGETQADETQADEARAGEAQAAETQMEGT